MPRRKVKAKGGGLKERNRHPQAGDDGAAAASMVSVSMSQAQRDLHISLLRVVRRNSSPGSALTIMEKANSDDLSVVLNRQDPPDKLTWAMKICGHYLSKFHPDWRNVLEAMFQKHHADISLCDSKGCNVLDRVLQWESKDDDLITMLKACGAQSTKAKQVTIATTSVDDKRYIPEEMTLQEWEAFDFDTFSKTAIADEQRKKAVKPAAGPVSSSMASIFQQPASSLYFNARPQQVATVEGTVSAEASSTDTAPGLYP